MVKTSQNERFLGIKVAFDFGVEPTACRLGATTFIENTLHIVHLTNITHYMVVEVHIFCHLH